MLAAWLADGWLMPDGVGDHGMVMDCNLSDARAATARRASAVTLNYNCRVSYIPHSG